ncbi:MULTISPECIES: efflux RND transporter periplasmic adaptor subunit [Acetobacter]|uniref:HlyD family secretion protein n=1 Tax=Acetobacter thailandicus TaxID=1502842 RepID=A0ABT3QB88_9PROT|nr:MULTISPECIES: HlyD family secretion protein [Acetobacter]MBS0959249.1 HlyD family secretion protein [Acetobacter thailandicus]MBS0984854.1 HlyD family secretion protein [Acetobacter thailandicus]MBS1003622.1 HlyD family secretion protein [Acetobacter thailandicus]MCX2562568.1 HlyD family secretion protein [Acetobacter thailandicus]NHN94634.1 efflux RND transporter periplasmic adaptor subunit [Acetobacter thailandicus]
MFERARRVLQLITTGTILFVAAIVSFVLWDYYTAAPWTRNGQVRVQVADIAPRVSGQIISVNVKDNQFVHKGDILYEIDPFDFQVAVAVATAKVNERQADMVLKDTQRVRRKNLSEVAASNEEKQVYEATAEVAKAQYADAVAHLSQANINLERTHIRSTVTGYVNNLIMRTGDFATAGTPNIQVIDSSSFWVDGYFEETKIRAIHIGDRVRMDLMGYSAPMWGHVVSITHGIATPNATPSVQGLPAVDPVYTWVRLAQRIPVRVHIDSIPPGTQLAAGMTTTVTVVGSKGKRAHDTLTDTLDRLHDTLMGGTGGSGIRH